MGILGQAPRGKRDLGVEPTAKTCNRKLLLFSDKYKRGVAWTGNSDYSASF